MSNVLIIKAHQTYPIAKGELNTLIANDIEAFFLSHGFSVKHTIVSDGYDIETEQNKFLWSDIIIFQFPIFWFNAPAILHQYIQDVYGYGVFYTSSETYGQGGLLTGKKYMFSTTWGASKDIFCGSFWEGCTSPDDILTPLHNTQKYVGLTPLPTFACMSVVGCDNTDQYRHDLQTHLENIMLEINRKQ